MRLKAFILALIYPVAIFSADGGVVVFNNGTTLVTLSQSEKDGQLAVKMVSGDAVFALDQVAWHSATADSLWSAAQAAQKDGKMNVAVILARESFLQEPSNAAAAKQLVVEQEARIEQARVATAPQAPAGGGFAPAAGAAAAGQPAGAESPPAETEPSEVGAHGWLIENAISAEDLRINAIVVGIFGLIVLFTVWKMTVSEA